MGSGHSEARWTVHAVKYTLRSEMLTMGGEPPIGHTALRTHHTHRALGSSKPSLSLRKPQANSTLCVQLDSNHRRRQPDRLPHSDKSLEGDKLKGMQG